MRIEVRLKIDPGEGNAVSEEVLVLDKPHDQLEQIGGSVSV